MRLEPTSAVRAALAVSAAKMDCCRDQDAEGMVDREVVSGEMVSKGSGEWGMGTSEPGCYPARSLVPTPHSLVLDPQGLTPLQRGAEVAADGALECVAAG